ncbi:MAG TPA: hypothetical protein VI072_19450 [Polyangiaceae bacterium]
MHGRLGQLHIVGNDLRVLCACNLEERGDRQLGRVLLHLAKQVDHVRRDRAGATVVGADAGHERVETAATVRTKPAAHGLRGNVAPE